jgi:hypothetical protein
MMVIAFVLALLMMTEQPARSSPKILWEYKTGG